VALQVCLHLTLGLDHKAQAHSVAAQLTCSVANGKCTGIPKRVQKRRAVVQVIQPLLGPSQVVRFFAAGFVQLCAQRWALACQGLAGVKRLRANLSHMVHAHQGSGFPALGIGQHQLRRGGQRRGAAGAGLGPQGAQSAVSGQNQSVDVHKGELNK
jgi:hypothetical protein